MNDENKELQEFLKSKGFTLEEVYCKQRSPRGWRTLQECVDCKECKAHKLSKAGLDASNEEMGNIIKLSRATICVECAFCFKEGWHLNLWSYRCSKSPLKNICYVTGKATPGFEHCATINRDGKCKIFKKAG